MNIQRPKNKSAARPPAMPQGKSVPPDEKQGSSLTGAGTPMGWLLVRIAIIVLAAGFVYAPSFHGDWLWDDDQAIWQNPILKDPQGLQKIWSPTMIFKVLFDPKSFGPNEFKTTDFWPLTESTRWVLFQFWQDNKTGWHVTNVVLHAIGCLLLWRLFHRLKIPGAWWGGLLFAIHPVLIESVAWVSEIKNTLSLPFLLIAFTAFIDFEENGDSSHYALAILAFLAAMLAKTSVIMAPVVVLLYCWWKSGQIISVRAILLSLPFFVISLALAWTTIAFQHANAIGTEKILVGDLDSRIATAGMAILFYFWKTVWPIGLNVIYPRWEVDPPQWWQFLPWPLLLAVFIWLWTYRKTWGRHVLFGLGFFVINLVPVLGFVTMSYMRITWVADHFVYLPAIGLIGLFVAGLATAYQRLKPALRPAMVVAVTILATIMTLSSHGYAGIFVNEDELWTYTLKRNPNAWQAHNRLGAKKFSRGEVDAALYHFQNSSRLRPDLGETHNNLGAALMQLNRKEEAIVAFEKALVATPQIIATQANLANAYAQVGRWDESAKHFAELVSGSKQPNNPIFHGNLGAVLLQLGRKEEAIYHLRRAYEINPNLQGLKENLERAGVSVGAPLSQPTQFKLGQ